MIDDIPWDIVRADSIEILLEVGADNAIIGGILLSEVEIAIAFDAEDESGPTLHSRFSLSHIDDILTLSVARESAVVLKIVEAHHISDAMSLGSAEADTAKDASDKSDVSVFDRAVGYLAHFNKFGSKEKAADIGFSLFPSAILVFESLTDIALTVDSILDTQTVSDLVEADIREEGIEIDVILLVVADEEISDRDEDIIELSLHSVFELETAGALFELDTFIVGEVDSDSLRSGVAIAGIIDNIIDIEVAFGARHFLFIFRVAGELFLEVWEHFDKLSEVVAPFHILDEDESLVGGLIAEESVVVVLDRSDNEVEFRLFHIHPSHIGGEIIVGFESLAAFGEILFKAWVLGEIDSLSEKRVDLSEFVGISDMIGDHFESAVLVAADDSILACFGRVVESIELLDGHIGWVEISALRTFADAGDKRFLRIEAVPSTVMDISERLHSGVGERVESFAVSGAVGLFPVELVHNLAYFDKDRDKLFFLIGEDAEVGRERELGILVDLLLKFGGLILGRLLLVIVMTSDGSQHSERDERDKNFFHHETN